MRTENQKVMSKGAKRRISCALACVFEILHYVQNNKMKAHFYFETTSVRRGILICSFKTLQISRTSNLYSASLYIQKIHSC